MINKTKSAHTQDSFHNIITRNGEHLRLRIVPV